MVNEVEEQPGISRDTSFHGKGHGENGRDKVLHSMLGFLHTDTDATAAEFVEGDILDVNAAGKLTRVARSVPGGANLLNVWSFITGTTRGAYRALFDATVATTIAEGDTADAGTGVIAARVNHKHGSPATWLATQHNILDANRHGDAATATIARGDILYGNSTPKIDRLAKPATPAILGHDATDVAWDTMAWTTPAFNAGDFTCLTAGTWTVAAGDVTTFKYRLIGKTMLIQFAISTSTVVRSGGSPLGLQILIPAGKTANGFFVAPLARVIDNGVNTTGFVQTTGTQLLCFRTDVAQWANATDATYVYGQIMLETT